MISLLSGKVALVTGGSRGIGAAVAIRLAQEGADVAFTFQHNKQRANDVVEAIKDAGRRALGRFATPTDIAGAVAFLAGPDGAITGTSVTVDGGFTN